MRSARAWAATVTVSGLAFTLLAAWAIDRAGTTDDSSPSQVLVVLGARVEPDGAPSPTLRARVEHAVRLYRAGLAPALLFAGGQGDFGEAEAQVALRLAVSLGVPAGACLVEAQSHSTAQNAAFSARIMRAQGWQRAVVVTDPYHLPRARRLLERQGFTVTGSPVLQAPRHRSPWLRLGWTLREVVALARLSVQ